MNLFKPFIQRKFPKEHPIVIPATQLKKILLNNFALINRKFVYKIVNCMRAIQNWEKN